MTKSKAPKGVPGTVDDPIRPHFFGGTRTLPTLKSFSWYPLGKNNNGPKFHPSPGTRCFDFARPAFRNQDSATAAVPLRESRRNRDPISRARASRFLTATLL